MKRTSRDGLVLLVVLGMLALFSLLTVTYVVFASQSKSSNVAMSRRYIHESSASTRPLFEEAIKQLIRGTKDGGSALWGSDLLGDLYGPNETDALSSAGSIVVRSFQAVSGAQMTHLSDCLDRPMLLGSEFSTPYLPGRFLRIPIAFKDKSTGAINLTSLPQFDDVLTGRLITFENNQGPLAGQTFRVHRYIGDQRSNSDPFLRASSYSIVIDLAECNLAKQHNQFVSIGAGNRRSVTGTIADWVLLYPPLTGYDKWACGVYLCYGEVVESTLQPLLNQGYELFLNAVPINSHGISVGSDGSTQFHELVAPGMGQPMPDPDINYMPSGFQLNTQLARVVTAANNPAGSLLNPDGSRTTVLVGDADEPVDAADLDTLFMSYTEPGVASSGEIIPSFHRAHLINYIVNWKDYNSYSELDFWATIRRIQMAVKRPLGMTIVTPSGTPAFMGTTASPYSINANFDAPGIKPLVIVSPNNWGTYWSTTGRFIFKAWLDQITAGTWDVDNDGDGVNDSVWTNIGLPLQRTADGKLLMALVAYHIEDLDGKIDINAAGSTTQANNYVFSEGLSGGLFTRPESSPVPNGFKTPSVFAKGVVARSTTSGAIIGGPTPDLMVSQYFDQGQGVGPADIGFRHLLSKSGLAWVSRSSADGSPILVSGVPQVTSGFEGSEQAYAFIMAERYKPNSNAFDFNWAPGGLGVSSGTFPSFLLGDAANRSHFISQFLLRPDLLNHQGSHHHSEGLTGLPVGIRGRVSVGLDRLGNPAIYNDDKVMTANNNEYESRLISSPFQDSPFTLDEFEPIYRNHDSDMAASSNRMKAAFGETTTTLPSSSLKHEVTPISRSLRAARLGARATNFSQSPASSYFELVKNIQELKQHPTASQVSYDTFKQLFPLEFIRNESFNLNRPFGNGVLEAPAGYDVDEPTELISFNQRAIEATATYQVTTHPFNVDSLATADTTGLDIGSGMETRQLFARNLYSIAQLLVPDDYAFPNVDRTYWQSLCQIAYSNTSTDDSKFTARQRMIKLRARVLAQWAVNVADFRDSDGAMTRFAYDEDPYRRLNVYLNRFKDTGGNIVGYQGNIARNETAGWTVTPRCVVWGMEQPEALLTESLAFHDTKIRKDEVAPSDRYDQFRMPQGSLFLEIYNPRSTAAVDATVLPAIPKSLYSNSGGDTALNLSKLSPANSGGEVFPVWRVYISGPVNKAALTQTLKTPNERLKATGATSASKFDLTYQLPTSNILDTTLNWTNASAVNTRADVVRAGAGLIFDHADTTQQLPDPSPSQSRVILFTRDSTFVPTTANTPGVANSQQVFYNRNTTDIMLKGNQYLTIGPRTTTYLGSRTSSKTSASGRPGNQPSRHRITLSNNDWIYAYDDAGVEYRGLSTNVRSPLAMVAAAPIPTSPDWATPPANSEATFTRIGISVSEPLPIDNYYARPDERVNSNNNTADTTAPSGITPTNAPGFANASIEADAYFDYQTPGAGALAPFDNPTTTQGPLRNWDINADGVPDTQSGVTQFVAAQGTINDWCTAYLQRLADPNKAFDETLNPYITVDWIPIDLTVFHGEETLSGAVKLASRQKLGSCIIPESLAFDAGAGKTGKSFLTTLTNELPTAPAGGTDNFLKFRLNADQGSFAASPRPTLGTGTDSFMTLGFLNSGFMLATESPNFGNVANLPAPYIGAPADPNPDPITANPQWHPATVFWANRPYINSFELAYVPVSSPGQLGQEFSAQFGGATANYYAASYTNTDPRMPSSPYSEFIRNDVAPNGVPDPAFPGLNLPGRSTAGVTNSSLAYPFGHLLNFFQEMPDLRTPYAHLSRNAPRYDAYTQQHAKDTSLAQMLDWIDTLSPWADVENLQSPNLFQQRTFDPANDFGRLIATNNVIFAPYRAPYNNMSRRVEPGKINVNSIKSQNVWHGLLYNTLEPSDIDFSPVAPSSPFAEVNGDIDYNRNGVNDGAANGGDPERPERMYPGTANTKMVQLYNNFLTLRRGYAGAVNGAYVPPSGLAYHKDIPSMFGGAFMPASEYGMKPVTRLNASYGSVPANYQPPNVPPNKPLSAGSPASVTLMRNSIGTNEPGLTAALGAMDKSNAYTQFYPISRLQKLTTERSNTFAVYTTIGLFEIDSAGDIGKEYGIDSGEARRFKAFYIIDRSAPIGYRIGEDHNTESTILIRRILAE